MLQRIDTRSVLSDRNQSPTFESPEQRLVRIGLDRFFDGGYRFEIATGIVDIDCDVVENVRGRFAVYRHRRDYGERLFCPIQFG